MPRYAYATLHCEFRLRACNFASAIDTYRYSAVNFRFLPTLATPLQNCAAAAPAAMRVVTPNELATKGNAAGVAVATVAVAVGVVAGSDPVAGPLSALSSFDSVWSRSYWWRYQRAAAGATTVCHIIIIISYISHDDRCAQIAAISSQPPTHPAAAPETDANDRPGGAVRSPVAIVACCGTAHIKDDTTVKPQGELELFKIITL